MVQKRNSAFPEDFFPTLTLMKLYTKSSLYLNCLLLLIVLHNCSSIKALDALLRNNPNYCTEGSRFESRPASLSLSKIFGIRGLSVL